MKFASVMKTLVVGATFMVLAFATPITAVAQTNDGILRVSYQGETHTGLCCSTWSDPIQVREPEKSLPIVVTFRTDYSSSGAMLVGLQLNNGPCTFYGPAFLLKTPLDAEQYGSVTMQWVIMPGDYGLVRGANTIRLCGGGASQPDTIELGFHTVVAHVHK